MKKDKVFEINNRQELEKKAACAVLRLKQLYKDAACSLEFGSEGWRLMVMGRLSAQCTDKRVNIVCRELFEKYPTPYDLANASLEEVENIIRPCGLYRTKARDIIGECKMLVEDYGSVLPDSVEELILFPGVGRKV